MNVEPSVLTGERPEWLATLSELAAGRFAVFAEFTERSLADRPAELLASVERMRRLGIGIALDDVGADPRSLALMPFLAPDVIKLDLRLVQENPSLQVAEIVHAVSAEAERTGALVLAEGIETELHRETALALGARYGQGWLFGRPAPLGVPGEPVERSIRVSRRERAARQTSPFEVVSANRPTRRGSKRLLLALSLQIEARRRGPSFSRESTARPRPAGCPGAHPGARAGDRARACRDDAGEAVRALPTAGRRPGRRRATDLPSAAVPAPVSAAGGPRASKRGHSFAASPGAGVVRGRTRR